MFNHRKGASDRPRPRAKQPVFGILLSLAYILAMLPPAYIWMGEQHGTLFRLPISIWYMFGVCIFAVAVCWALYIYEGSRKELD